MDTINKEGEGVPRVIDNVTLDTLVRVVGENTKILVKACDGTRKAVDLMLEKDQELGGYIKQAMGEALTPEDADLIAETAIVVYQVVKATPPPVSPELLAYRKSSASSITKKSIIATTEDDIFPFLKDKNAIWITLKDEMHNHPDLTMFITENMRGTVNLEDANLVGTTALVIYRAINFFLSSPPGLLK